MRSMTSPRSTESGVRKRRSERETRAHPGVVRSAGFWSPSVCTQVAYGAGEDCTVYFRLLWAEQMWHRRCEAPQPQRRATPTLKARPDVSFPIPRPHGGPDPHWPALYHRGSRQAAPRESADGARLDTRRDAHRRALWTPPADSPGGSGDVWRGPAQARVTRPASQEQRVTVRRRIAPPPAAAKLHVTVSDHAASQPDGPCHGHGAPYHDSSDEVA
jgi:hypothetical protein